MSELFLFLLLLVVQSVETNSELTLISSTRTSIHLIMYAKSKILLAIVGLLSLTYSVARKLEHASFEPPFDEIDNAGLRMVGKQWRTAGHAVVNNNFARLTPDRQSKKGALWSRKALSVPEFSAVLKFRISGQGKSFFGDGLALWIVQQSFYDAGDLHGFKENFQGVGIIFDTFRYFISNFSNCFVTSGIMFLA